uniref:YL1_C domain-containing protein n=1 Tax=Macrostomum lignano TaxID=282301 RepID=A0A1I8FI09_9PLAT
MEEEGAPWKRISWRKKRVKEAQFAEWRPMREPSYEQPDRPLQPVDEDDDILVDARAIAPRHQLGVASAASADRTRPAEKSSKKHEAAERKRNKKRLRRRATAERQARVGPASDAPAGAYDRVDGAVPDTGPHPAGPELTRTDKPRCRSCARAAGHRALRRSPYATGDAVARILPYLETKSWPPASPVAYGDLRRAVAGARAQLRQRGCRVR